MVNDASPLKSLLQSWFHHCRLRSLFVGKIKCLRPWKKQTPYVKWTFIFRSTMQISIYNWNWNLQMLFVFLKQLAPASFQTVFLPNMSQEQRSKWYAKVDVFHWIIDYPRLATNPLDNSVLPNALSILDDTGANFSIIDWMSEYVSRNTIWFEPRNRPLLSNLMLQAVKQDWF